MLMDHVQGRALVREMEKGIADSSLEKLLGSCDGYILLLANHIHEENDVLFPLAERILPEGMAEEIYKAFEAHEEKVIGHGRHEELHSLLEELERRYG